MLTSKTVAHVDGLAIDRVTLQEGDQSVALLGIGAVTQDWRVGDNRPIILGYDDPVAYLDNRYYIGTCVGRVANRIGGAAFSVDGTRYTLSPNEGRNLLHSGDGGLHHRVFDMECDTAANAVRLTYRSPNGEGGFPANVDITIEIALKSGRLTYDITAVPDARTPINIAQHNYYNLMGQGDVWGHRVEVAADIWTAKDAEFLPDGGVLRADGRMKLDGQNPLDDIDPDHIGLDDNYVISAVHDRSAPVATLTSPDGATLRMWSDQPALQVYSSGGLGAVSGGLGGRRYGRFGAICLEPQNFPDAINHTHFPDVIYGPDRPYHQRLEIEVTT